MIDQTGLEALAGLPFRDAIAEIADKPYRIAAQGSDDSSPVATIAIPTYQRPHFLAEAIASVLAQRFDLPFEIVVVDNDPESAGPELLLGRFPELRSRKFRYLVNNENIGLFHNHNRCIDVARAPWLSILNDDDLLDPAFLKVMFAAIDRNREIDGLICRKQVFDQREGGSVDHGATRSLPWHLAKRALLDLNFLGRRTRNIPQAKFFWGAVLGSTGGWLFKRDLVRRIGGYYPEEFPASDLWLLARFAKLHQLRQHRDALIRVRIAENETARPSTVKTGLEWGYRLQSRLVGWEVPWLWGRLLPLIIAQHRAEFRDFWRVEIPKQELEDALGIRLPKERRILLRFLQVVLRGF
ncbi:MAG TPA: glycosyltransferase [Sphingomonas sp.]|uniref:glycosyltransferase family 2 protein n=1 Tax=Sphingomonas sp. TaxID=28214 RepID=UPI002ED82F2F